MRIGGVVLCGGLSRRMGRPKAWLPFGGEVLLVRVLRRLSAVAAPLVVVAGPGQEVPPLPDEVLLVRDPVGNQGPLQGLVTGLDALGGQVEAVYLSSCDVPFVQPALVGRLGQLLAAHWVCVLQANGYLHPLAAIYRAEVASTASRLLAEGERRATALVDHVPTRLVTPKEVEDIDPLLQGLRNINTPNEYEAALAEAFLCRS